MASRLQLQTLLEELLGSHEAYFQPPASVFMSYPAIVYSLYDIQNTYANNGVYTQDTAYQVTVIDEDPDSEIVKKISKLPRCSFDRAYRSDNLNHTVFTLYF